MFCMLLVLQVSLVTMLKHNCNVTTVTYIILDIRKNNSIRANIRQSRNIFINSKMRGIKLFSFYSTCITS